MNLENKETKMVDFFDVFFTGADFERIDTYKSKENIFWAGKDNELTLEIHIPGYDKSDVKVSIVEEYNTKYLILAENESNGFKYKTSIPNGYKISEDCRVENGIFSMKFEKYQDVKEINIL
jgi:HSP20 family molecular chaperone IbpA